MSLYISSLNSGSNGNCYYIGTETEAVLVDAGISCRQIEKRMKNLGLLIEKVKAVFISHEHSDHINGLESLVKKYRFPVYITPRTLRSGRLQLQETLINNFNAHRSVSIGSLEITAFPKYHDAVDPYSFVVSAGDICVGIFTDIGTPCKDVIHYFQKCNAAFLEANYDDEMLHNGRYPFHLKKRISGRKGHLSNQQALELFRIHRPVFMSHILLSHLSHNNNCPELVENLFNKYAENIKVIIASRHRETEVFLIRQTAVSQAGPSKTRQVKPKPVQLSFSFV